MGAEGRRSAEVTVAWEVSEALTKALQAKGYRVICTKSLELQMVSDRLRAQIANHFRSDLLVRLHCDAGPGSGFAVYYPDRQGKVNGFRGPSPRVLKASRERAVAFHRAMAAKLRGRLRDRGLQPDTATAIGARQGALTGSIYAEIPVLLVEMVVITNPKDENFILSARGRKRMVEALVDGVVAAAGPPL